MIENVYFSFLLLFQASVTFTGFWERLPLPFTVLFTFLPYTLIRPLFPRTSLGDSRHDDKQYTNANRFFLKTVSLLSKIFYVWAKHLNGYYLNYLVWVGLGKGEDVMYRWHWLLIAGGWGTTIAMFLNTLKYKKYIGAKTALGAYALTFPVMMSILTSLQWHYREHSWLSWIVMIGVPVNFLPREWKAQHIYQFLVLGYLYKYHNFLDGTENMPAVSV